LIESGDTVLDLFDVEFVGSVSSQSLGPDLTHGESKIFAGVSVEVNGRESSVEVVINTKNHTVHEGPSVSHTEIKESRPGGDSGVELLGEKSHVTLRVLNGHVDNHSVELVNWVDPVSVGPVRCANVVRSRRGISTITKFTNNVVIIAIVNSIGIRICAIGASKERNDHRVHRIIKVGGGFVTGGVNSSDIELHSLVISLDPILPVSSETLGVRSNCESR
jgi:hypothetical protein